MQDEGDQGAWAKIPPVFLWQDSGKLHKPLPLVKHLKDQCCQIPNGRKHLTQWECDDEKL